MGLRWLWGGGRATEETRVPEYNRESQVLISHPWASSSRWAKGGFLIEDAHESRYETNVDYSFFTEPVSCEVYNKVGSTNVSTLVNVHCE